jgi:pimeloyl-ACP methyl ester carboxylesterase
MVSDLYPFESHFLGLDGLRLHYLDEGSGDPVVMVHGNPTWSFYYRNLVKGLRGSYRTIVPDHIGCGLSDKPDASQYPYSLDRRARDLESLLDHLGLFENITLVVHDWGGMIGMLFASRNPERIKRLVVLNTGAFHLPKAKRFPPSLALVRNTPLGPLLVRGLNAFSLGAARACVRRPMSPEVRRGYLAPYDSWANRVAVLRFVQTIPLKPGDEGYDLVTEVEDGLDQFRHLPVLICWGMHDFVFDRHFLAEWERHFPEAEVHRFDDAGHYVLEDAGDAILPLVQGFLAAHPLATATA